MILSPEAQAKLDGLTAAASLRLSAPAEMYEPHKNGQSQFHRARRRVRAMFPGNRWGKSSAMGVEADDALQGRSRFGRLRKPSPCSVWWFTPQFRQFGELRAQLDRNAFTKGYDYNAQDHIFRWPNGSHLTVFPADIDPHDVQGPNPRLICFDEEPPEALWIECNARGFGEEETEYVIAATATGGLTWMYDKLYLPWRKFHEDLGMDEDRAMLAQLHPDFWVWPKGGIFDNTSIAQAQAEKFANLDWGGPKQAKVRVMGGFADWVGDAVFDSEALGVARALAERMDRADGPGKLGSLVARPGRPGEEDGELRTGSAVYMGTLAQFEYSPLTVEGGRVEFWRFPEHGREYVIGADFAYGLEGRDWDTACVLRVGGGDQLPEQVAEAQGHWGPDFERILYGLLRFYNNAFLLGEAQVGLPILRRLREEYGYTRMFSERTEGGRTRRPTERLGYHTSASDVTLPKLRRFVLDKSIVWRSRPLLDQMGLLQFRPTNERLADKAMDVQLRVKLARGGSPDLVRAAGFAGHALGEVFWAPPQVQIAPEGSLGDILGYNTTMGITDKPKGIRWTR